MQNLTINTTTFSVDSSFCTLSKIVEDRSLFNIPIYQRLYVWGDDQIKTLLEDLYKGFIDQIEHYYLGGVMLSLNQEGKYDLIDGQQRFTTLWLIGCVTKHDLLQFNYLTEDTKKTARIGFSIRDHVNDFFRDPENFKSSVNHSTENAGELKPIREAIQTIEHFFNNEEKGTENKKDFSDFVLNKVLLMVTKMPQNTDENRLFEVLNNRGVQLQHHEILKAKMLRHIANENDRSKYAKLWDACSEMDEYIEKNIKDAAGLKWKELTSRPGEGEKQIDLPRNILDKIDGSHLNEKVHLLSVLTDTNRKREDISKNGNEEPDLEYDSGKVESIISFPMLLLHVLRVYQFEKDPQLSDKQIAVVDEKKLLQLFDTHFDPYWNDHNSAEQHVKAYIQLLWDLRVAFDKHVIKWIIKDNNLKIHGIKKLYLNKDALQRKEPELNEGFALLQSMLYHSQQIITHYWLTPLLNKFRSCDDVNKLYNYLRQVDNIMFCTGSNESLSQKSWRLLNQDSYTVKPSVQFLDLENHKGTSYPSYVFYKLDFILWYLRDHVFQQWQLKETKKEDWGSYRMTAKNSVEHISPQKPKEIDIHLVWNENDSSEEKKNKLDDFGNLVLLTSSMNSEYSNDIFTTKRSEFVAKAKSKRLDSLKSALIFENHSWGWKLCEEHRNEMKNLFTKYFSELP